MHICADCPMKDCPSKCLFSQCGCVYVCVFSLMDELTAIKQTVAHTAVQKLGWVVGQMPLKVDLIVSSSVSFSAFSVVVRAGVQFNKAVFTVVLLLLLPNADLILRLQVRASSSQMFRFLIYTPTNAPTMQHPYSM